MQLELVPEDEMAKPKKGGGTGKGIKDTVRGEGGDGGEGGDWIIKRIYFPGDTYSKKENQTEFKKILAAHGLVWVRHAMKTYPRKDGTALLTGMYASGDGKKKVFCIYEGTNKPMTAIVKIMGTGGNFLISLNSYCHKVGCVVEDKNEDYANKVILELQEKGEIYVEKKMETKSLEEIQREYEEKVEKRINDEVEKFINANRFVYDTYCECLFWRKGLSTGFIRKFRRMEIEKYVRQAIEIGFL